MRLRPLLLQTMTSLLLTTLPMAGCLDAIDAPRQADPDDPDPDDPDPNDPDPDDPDPDDPDPDDPNDPNTVETRRWCLPEAYPAPENYVLPEVPAEVLEPVCHLAQTTTYNSYNNSQSSVRYDWDGNVLWARMGDNLMKVTYSGDIIIEKQWGQRRGSQLEFAPWEDITRYRYDNDGHLTEFAIISGGIEHIYQTQEWANGKLVKRVAEMNVYNPDTQQSVAEPLITTWSYFGDQLANATATMAGEQWTADWTYDGQGRPTRVERKRGATVTGLMTWQFDANNRLARRTVMRDPQADVLRESYSPGPLDTLAVTNYDYWNGDPWAASVPREHASGCLVLPSTDEYGYPQDDTEYELGMPVAERPSGIGWAYGADTYGWNYGDLAWYSHAGVHGFEPNYYDGRRDSDLRYVNGVLVEETTSSTSGPIKNSHRLRSFVDGNLVVDRRDLVVESYSTDGQTTTLRDVGRELRFSWDIKSFEGQRDRLIQRELVDDERGVLESQSWNRDAEGRWLSHSVLGWSLWGSAAKLPFYDYDPCSEQVCDGILKLRVYFSRELDDAGRTLTTRTARPNADGILTEEQSDRRAYDAAGNLVWLQQNGGYLQTWEYDANNRLVREAYDYDGMGEPEGWTQTTYDELGRWLEKTTWSQGALQSRTTRTFVCE